MHALDNLLNYQPSSNLLEDRNILVTGAGAGIGRAAALSFARHGATVALLGRTESKLERVYDEIIAQGDPQPAIVPIDLETADAQQYQQLADILREQFGTLHGLLHNAAILGEMKPLLQYSPQTFKQVIDTNLLSHFLLSQALIPLMLEADDASIVFTSSSVGRKSRAYWGAYAVSKFGIEGLMQTWADELADISTIRVNSLNPGATRTPMRQQAFPAENPQRNPEAERIMGPYLFLMGPESAGITGRQISAR